MLLQTFVISAVAMATVVASNFCPSFAPFYSDYGYALVDHVIKTLPLFKPDCMSVCQETLNCFSINIYKQNGGLMCDLNRSNKKQRPGSFVAKTGCEYAESKNMRYCVKDDCPLKDALPGNKFKFNSSNFEFFADRKNWTNARQHCQGLGGDLASFSSETELKFVLETLLRSFFLTAIKMLYMDGTDIGLNLFGGARFEVKDNRSSLFLQKDTYATTPRFNFYTTDLTIGLWVNLKSIDEKMYILNDEGGSGRSARIYFDKGELRAEMEFLSGGNNFQSNGRISTNEWHHIALTWHRASRRFRSYFNGIPDKEEENQEPDPNLKPTTEPYFLIGKRHSSSPQFNGWISDWVVFFQTLSKDEIGLLKDGKVSEGAWIGLSDIQVENKINWSDGTPLVYQPNNDLSNTDDKDCGYINWNISTSKWTMDFCEKKLPFICEYHDNRNG